MYAHATALCVQAFSRPTIDIAALNDHLRDAEIETICDQHDHRWRERIFTPAVTIRSIVYRGLHADKSIHAVLTDMAATAPWAAAPSDAAWCRARNRLPVGVLDRLAKQAASRVIRRYGDEFHYWNRPVYRFDGAVVSMPDTPELAGHFGYANTKHGLSRFPVARLAVWVAAGTEVVCRYRLDPYITDERVQFRASWDCLPRGAICVCDRHFSNFYDLAKLRQRGVAMVTRLHQRRKPDRLIAAGSQIGPNQWRVPLELAPQTRRRYDDPSLPQKLWVRLIRVIFRRHGKRRTLWLVTTLMNANRYRRKAIVRLYRDRWIIETRIGTIKVTLAVRVLRSKTVDGVRKELAGRLLAYNLVWSIIHQAAAATGVDADRISFTDAARVILAFSVALRALRGRERDTLYMHMLDYVAIHTNPRRPGRIEPRLIKRERRKYGFLKEPREKARLLA